MLSEYTNKRVLVTGHTGFKGSWLCAILESLGASTLGYSLAPAADSHFNCLSFSGKSVIADINDEGTLNKVFSDFRPDIVFHLAAQPLVRESYLDPVSTYETNVVGSLKVYRASVSAKSKAIVSITTDKVYENREWSYGYRENDRLGGHDPYSSSKACMEIMTQSFRNSFLADNGVLLATARAGNVIGGGDWAKDRIVPDLARSAMSEKSLYLRNPLSVRPWQHVLEPLVGYLQLGERLLRGESQFARAFNFGPSVEEHYTVLDVCEAAKAIWDRVSWQTDSNQHPHEAGLLKLDTTFTQAFLGWKPRLDFAASIFWTMEWYREFHEKGDVLSKMQIENYLSRVR